MPCDTATNYESVFLETDIYKPSTVGHVWVSVGRRRAPTRN